MNPQVTTIGRSQSAAMSTNKVVRNTYMLLSMTLAFSALTAGTSMALNLPHPGLIITLVGYFGLLFLTTKFRDSGLGLAFVFALTGFMGYTLGPILNAYLALPNGAVVMMAMGAPPRSSRPVGLVIPPADFSFMAAFAVGIHAFSPASARCSSGCPACRWRCRRCSCC
jgi:modulator of FtsH protease